MYGSRTPIILGDEMTVEKTEISDSQVKVDVKTDAKKNAGELIGSSLIDKRREEVERIAIEENDKHSSAIIGQLLEAEEPAKAADDVKSEDKPAEKKEEVVEDKDPIKKVMSKVQKRIDKEVAKRKTIEEELAETRAELEKIREAQNVMVVGNKDDNKEKNSEEPTEQQIAAYLRKVREDGNVEEEVRVLDYIAQRRTEAAKKAALEEYAGRDKAKVEAKAKQDAQIQQLLMDYVVRDENGKIVADDPMNLANEKGLLRQTADALFHNPDLKAQYSDADKVMAYRRAVNDAFRTIYQLGLNNPSMETVESAPKLKRKAVLVEPSSDTGEEVSDASPQRLRSDQDKVIDEIKNRRSFQVTRTTARQ